jgi:hypothetical protein
MRRACDHCVFWQAEATQTLAKLHGVCRRYPPEYDQDAPILTANDYWCGEFKVSVEIGGVCVHAGANVEQHS